jgi:hypothetical protein
LRSSPPRVGPLGHGLERMDLRMIARQRKMETHWFRLRAELAGVRSVATADIALVLSGLRTRAEPRHFSVEMQQECGELHGLPHWYA